MSRSVYEVKNVLLALVLIIQSASLQFYGNASFFFDFPILEQLLAHFARGNGASLFDEPVGKRTLAVIDMRDYGKIAYVFLAQFVLFVRKFLP